MANYVAATLRANLAATRDLIAQEGQSIVLTRPGAFQDDGAGGKLRSGADTDLPAQQLFFSYLVYEPQEMDLVTGQTIYIKFVLIGMPDADITAGDYFWVDNKKHLIDNLTMHRDYERRAEGKVYDDGE